MASCSRRSPRPPRWSPASRRGDDPCLAVHRPARLRPVGRGARVRGRAAVPPTAAAATATRATPRWPARHADIEVVTPTGLSYGVAETRELVARRRWRPAGGRWQVMVVEDADRFTEQAPTRCSRRSRSRRRAGSGCCARRRPRTCCRRSGRAAGWSRCGSRRPTRWPRTWWRAKASTRRRRSSRRAPRRATSVGRGGWPRRRGRPPPRREVLELPISVVDRRLLRRRRRAGRGSEGRGGRAATTLDGDEKAALREAMGEGGRRQGARSRGRRRHHRTWRSGSAPARPGPSAMPSTGRSSTSRRSTATC